MMERRPARHVEVDCARVVRLLPGTRALAANGGAVAAAGVVIRVEVVHKNLALAAHDARVRPLSLITGSFST